MKYRPKLSITLLVASEKDTRFTIGVSNIEQLTIDQKHNIIDELTRRFMSVSFDVARSADADLSMLIDTNAPHTHNSILTYEEIMQQIGIKSHPDPK